MERSDTHDSETSVSTLRLIRSAGQSPEGRVSELTDTGILVDFRHSDAPEVSVGEWVSAVASCGRTGSSVQFSGRVIARTEELDRQRVRFELGPDDLTAMSLLVDRRGHMRVRPQDDLKARLCSPAGESLTLAAVHDLSSTGISVMLDAEAARTIAEHRGVFLVCLLLPGDGETLEMAAVVRNQEGREGGGQLLGLEFGTTGASTFLREVDRIERYVASVQAAQLRESAPAEPS